MFRSSTVAVDSEIYLWVDNQSRPIKQESRIALSNAVEVFGGKIYAIQDLKHGEIEEKVYDLETQTWKVAGVPVPEEKVDTKPLVASSVSLEGKVYAMHDGSIIVYNLRQGRRKEKLEMPIDDWVWCICVADNVLFAFFTKCGLMWLDTKRNVWRVVTGDVQTLHRKLYGSAMAGYYGKLALFGRERDIGTTTTKTTKKKKKEEEIWCALIALERVEDGIRGTIEWFGVVATIPYVCRFLHCLVASD